MARITYGPLITDLSGSIGNITFQNNPSGSITRAKPAPAYYNSPKKRLFQLKLDQTNDLWIALSAADQALWVAMALANLHIDHFGRSKRLTGFQLFVSCNFNLLLCNRPTITQPAAWIMPAAFPAFTLSAVAGDLVMNFGGATVDNQNYWTIYATPPTSKTSIKDNSNYFIIYQALNHNLTHLHLNNYYQNIFGISVVTLASTSHCNIVVYARRIDKDTGYSCPFRISYKKIP